MSDDGFRSAQHPWVGAGQIDHLVADLTVRISAKATLDAVQRKLAEVDQWLPIDGPGGAAIGSLIEMNSTGPMRLGFGAWRDLILGMQFLNGRGELITVGGVPIKNVAGYDLGKFMIGGASVFGKIVSVVTRTYRRPAGAIVARFEKELATIPRAMVSQCRPAWAMVDGEHLTFGYFGDEGELAYYREAVGALEPIEVTEMKLEEENEYRQGRWKVAGPWGDWPWVFRASVPPTRILDFVRAAGVENWIADAAFGIVLGGADERVAGAYRGAAASMGGQLQCRAISDGSLISIAVNESERLILEKLKKAFDPDRKFSPIPTTI